MKAMAADYPRKVGIDCRPLTAGPAGVGTYVRNLLNRLPILEGYGPRRPQNNFLWNQLRVPLAQLRRRWVLYHAPGYTAPLVKFRPLVLAVHDVSYLVRAEWYPYRLGSFRKAYYQASIRRADRILVPSRFSQQELLRLLPGVRERIRYVPLGVSEEFFNLDSALAEHVKSHLGLPDRYLLHVGDLHTRRRIGLLSEAARQAGIPLVLVGKVLEGGGQLENLPCRFSGLPSEQLKGIYSGAEAFIFASEYEGFGLPLLEAMASSVPVVAVPDSCLPEVCGDAPCWVNPDVCSFVSGIRAVLADRSEFVRRGLERARQFSWDTTAAKTLEVYRELAQGDV
jgi:glycosyltransferase involved in cell wall biosynthesis